MLILEIYVLELIFTRPFLTYKRLTLLEARLKNGQFIDSCTVQL